MKTPILVASLMLSSLLGLGAVTFEEMPPVTKRVAPNGASEILSFSSAIAQARVSIVYIATSQNGSQKMIDEMNPIFEYFFGRRFQPLPQSKRQSLGSGVIISDEGYIVTNYHVIEDADEIMVKIAGSQHEFAANVVGKDPKSDLAVIRIEAKNLVPIKMGSSADLQLGDVVFAIGNPFGVGMSVTQGIVSARHKSGIGINEYENFIQTDASINPGNSGGALIDSRGALIGINSAIISRSGGNDGIGFAIEVDMVKQIVRDLIEHGTVERGFLGVSITDLTTELRDLYQHSEGAVIIDVTPGSPANAAGLQRGDLIVSIDTQQIKNATDLKNRIGALQPEQEISISYEREKITKTLAIRLSGSNSGKDTTVMFEGLILREISDQDRQQLKLPADVDGVMVAQVDVVSKAAGQGVAPGDVIIQVEQTPVNSLPGLRNVLGDLEDDYKRVYIYRKGRIFVVVLK